MCTLSWIRKEATVRTGNYTVFFNRDEQRTRPVALPPKRHQNDSSEWISATDPQGSGTWLAINASGLSVAVLNSYESVDGSSKTDSIRSRGLLVTDLAGQCRGVASAEDELAQAVVRFDYRPFYLALIALERDSLWHWNGRCLAQMTPEGVVTSSSFQPERVIPYRVREYRERDDLESFHRTQNAEDLAASVLMSRSDAATVSISKIEVTIESGISYYYAEGPSWDWQSPVVLPLTELSRS